MDGERPPENGRRTGQAETTRSCSSPLPENQLPVKIKTCCQGGGAGAERKKGGHETCRQITLNSSDLQSAVQWEFTGSGVAAKTSGQCGWATFRRGALLRVGRARFYSGEVPSHQITCTRYIARTGLVVSCASARWCIVQSYPLPSYPSVIPPFANS